MMYSNNTHLSRASSFIPPFPLFSTFSFFFLFLLFPFATKKQQRCRMYSGTQKADNFTARCHLQSSPVFSPFLPFSFFPQEKAKVKSRSGKPSWESFGGTDPPPFLFFLLIYLQRLTLSPSFFLSPILFFFSSRVENQQRSKQRYPAS